MRYAIQPTKGINNKLLHFFVVAQLFFYNAAFAADPTPPRPGQGMTNTSNTANLSVIEERTNNAINSFKTFIYSIALLIGLVMIIKSLMNIAAISRNEKEGSIMMHFLSLFVGGMMTSVIFWLMFFSNSVKNLATGQ